jgi:hypothetical protein
VNQAMIAGLPFARRSHLVSSVTAWHNASEHLLSYMLGQRASSELYGCNELPYSWWLTADNNRR